MRGAYFRIFIMIFKNWRSISLPLHKNLLSREVKVLYDVEDFMVGGILNPPVPRNDHIPPHGDLQWSLMVYLMVYHQLIP
jgi:hypothetical protein